METNAETRVLNVPPRALLAGLVAIPVYVIPVGIWGVRALYPRVLRDVATGAITLGMVSLVGLGLMGLSRALSARVSERKQPGFAGFSPLVPDEVTASAVSAH